MAEGPGGHDGSPPACGNGSKSAAARAATPMVAELDEDIAHATTEDPHRRPGPGPLAGQLRRGYRFRHPRRAYPGAVPRTSGQRHPPRADPPRAGRRLHGRRLCAGQRQAGSVLRHHRAGRDQRRHRHRPGLRRLGAAAGDFQRQPQRQPGQGLGLPARDPGSACHDRADHCLLRPGLEPGTAARTDRPGLRGVRQRASAPGAYLDPARRACRAGGP